jgi:hypothetical protein
MNQGRNSRILIPLVRDTRTVNGPSAERAAALALHPSFALPSPDQGALRRTTLAQAVPHTQPPLKRPSYVRLFVLYSHKNRFLEITDRTCLPLTLML